MRATDSRQQFRPAEYEKPRSIVTRPRAQKADEYCEVASVRWAEGPFEQFATRRETLESGSLGSQIHATHRLYQLELRAVRREVNSHMCSMSGQASLVELDCTVDQAK